MEDHVSPERNTGQLVGEAAQEADAPHVPLEALLGTLESMVLIYLDEPFHKDFKILASFRGEGPPPLLTEATMGEVMNLVIQMVHDATTAIPKIPQSDHCLLRRILALLPDRFPGYSFTVRCKIPELGVPVDPKMETRWKEVTAGLGNLFCVRESLPARQEKALQEILEAQDKVSRDLFSFERTIQEMGEALNMLLQQQAAMAREIDSLAEALRKPKPIHSLYKLVPADPSEPSGSGVSHDSPSPSVPACNQTRPQTRPASSALITMPDDD